MLPMLRIDTIEICRLNVPMVHPSRTACGSDDAVGSGWVELVSGGGGGQGESPPFRFLAHCPACPVGVVERSTGAPTLA